MGTGAVSAEWEEYRQGWETGRGEVTEEAPLSIYVNGWELATILCTPREQDRLALGLLKNEGLIDDMSDVDHVHVSQVGCCADVWLTHSISRPEHRIITSGCGGGVTFDELSPRVEPIEDDLHIEPRILFRLFNELNSPGGIYARARGVHAAGLSDGHRLIAVAEDVGRHNTIDKLSGGCLLERIESRGRILLSTGRVSSEMLHKGARMGCPIIASRNSPTSMSIAMAHEWNITLIGYVRQRSMRVYTHPHRLKNSQAAGIMAAGD